MPDQHAVVAIVLHYRFWPGIRPTLDSILGQTRSFDRVIVVDNASEDGSLQALRRAYPTVEIMERSDNGGYAAAMNEALSCLGAREHAFLLTHDCELHEQALVTLLRHLDQSPDVGAVGPLLGWRSNRTRVWSAGGQFSSVFRRPTHVNQPVELSAWMDAAPFDVQWLDGAALLVRAEARASLDGFDERYFLYVEEVDYLQRLRARGWRIVAVPAALAWQEPGMAPPYLAARNLVLFRRRQRRTGLVCLAILGTAVHGLYDGWRRGRGSRRRYWSALVSGLADGFSEDLDRELARWR